MSDLASLGLRIQSEEAETADRRLEGLADAAGRAERATDSLAAGSGKANSAIATMGDAAMMQSRALTATQGAMRLTASEGLNMSRQMADIGVSMAMGMNPFMIALQQGPQLFDIMQQSAIRSGVTIRSAMMATGAAIWTAMAPLLPIIAAIGAAVAVMGGGIALATRGAREEIGNLTDGMNLTEKQMERLKESGVSTSVTIGDVFRGTGTTIKEVFFDAFGDQIDWLGRKWDEAMDWLGRTALAAIKGISGGFLGSLYVIRDTWKMLPAALGDVAVTAANAVLSGIEWMINAGIRGLNRLIDMANSAVDKIPGVDAFIPKLGEIEIARVGGRQSGAMHALGAQAALSWAEGWDAGGAFVDRSISSLVDNIRASGQARIRAGAGDASSSSNRGGATVRIRQESIDTSPARNIRDLPALRLLSDDLITPLEMVSNELRLIDNLSSDAAAGMASAFGATGEALGGLLEIMTRYQSRLAEVAVAEEQGRLTRDQAARESATAQIQSYGDMASAAKGFFKEGSDGYRALQAIEQAYRLFQFAMSVKSMAQQAAETATTVAQSAIRGGAKMAEGAAGMFAALGPLGFPAVAAMLAVLAALGLKGGSKGGGGSSERVSASVDAVQSGAGQAQAANDNREINVRVTADREGLNAYVEGTARRVTGPMVAQGVAVGMAAGAEQMGRDMSRAREYDRSMG